MTKVKSIAPPEPEVRKAFRKVKYEFNDEELLDLGKKLAGQVANKRNLENDKKQVVAAYAAKIAENVAQVEETQLKLTGGFEIREMECTVEIDWEAAKKHYKNASGEIVDSESLTADDYQYKLKTDNASAEESALVVESDKGVVTPISTKKKPRGRKEAFNGPFDPSEDEEEF